MAATALSALAAGILGWWLAQRGDLSLVGELAHRVPADRHVPFLADVWAHSASYVVGGMGGIVLMAFVWRARETSAINKTQ
jgi:hypothetical protein